MKTAQEAIIYLKSLNYYVRTATHSEKLSEARAAKAAYRFNGCKPSSREKNHRQVQDSFRKEVWAVIWGGNAMLFSSRKLIWFARKLKMERTSSRREQNEARHRARNAADLDCYDNVTQN